MQAALMGIIIFLTVHLVPGTVDQFQFSVPEATVKTNRTIDFQKTKKDTWLIKFMEGDREHERITLNVMKDNKIRIFQPKKPQTEGPGYEEYDFKKIFVLKGLDLKKVTEIPFTHNQGMITIERKKSEILIRAVSPDGDINPKDLMKITWEGKK